MVLQERLLTVEEFWEQFEGKPYELIHGRIVEIVPTGYSHGAVARRVASLLGDFVDENNLGDVVGAETGFRLNARTMRGADAAFIKNTKLVQIKELEKFLPFEPDLAVEVVSPHDTASEILDKVKLYLDAGTVLVWVIYPELREVVVHYPDRSAKTFTEAENLDGNPVIPGLTVPVAKLFPKPQKEEKNDHA
jgi:Uma2 family endonuclease